MKRSVSAFIGALVITLIVFGTAAGCIVADRRTAHMTFGTADEPLVTDNVSWQASCRSVWEMAARWLPARLRAGVALEQYGCQVVSDWIAQIFS